ncbi:MAG: entericidin A/B family lipoprotein, partial [Rickettsia endosymbiont of Haemaphysalis japonica]
TSACNTMQGAGQDMQAAGKKLKDSTESNKPQKGCSCPHRSAN